MLLDPKSSSRIPGAGVIKEVPNKMSMFVVIFCYEGEAFQLEEYFSCLFGFIRGEEPLGGGKEFFRAETLSGEIQTSRMSEILFFLYHSIQTVL